MNPELPFDELGAWSQVPADLQPPLVEDRRADVVVIGGMSAMDRRIDHKLRRARS